jgi:hypothetical protein
MIPDRMLSNEVYGSGLKDRVIACRKRLRVNRVMQRTLVNDEVEELFPETSPSVSEFNDRAAGNLPECSAISTSSVRVEGRAPFSPDETEDGAAIVLTERGVGIT